jgi:hypothetical protein
MLPFLVLIPVAAILLAGGDDPAAGDPHTVAAMTEAAPASPASVQASPPAATEQPPPAAPAAEMDAERIYFEAGKTHLAANHLELAAYFFELASRRGANAVEAAKALTEIRARLEQATPRQGRPSATNRPAARTVTAEGAIERRSEHVQTLSLPAASPPPRAAPRPTVTMQRLTSAAAASQPRQPKAPPAPAAAEGCRVLIRVGSGAERAGLRASERLRSQGVFVDCQTNEAALAGDATIVSYRKGQEGAAERIAHSLMGKVERREVADQIDDVEVRVGRSAAPGRRSVAGAAP